MECQLADIRRGDESTWQGPRSSRLRLQCARCRSSRVRRPQTQGGAAPAAQAPAAPQGRGGGGGGFGGSGNLKVLLITKGHAYDREPFYQLFDQPPVGASARWTHVEQPAAEIFFDPALAKDYDVFVFYDINGSQSDRRKPRVDKTGKPVRTRTAVPRSPGTRRPPISSRIRKRCCVRASR